MRYEALDHSKRRAIATLQFGMQFVISIRKLILRCNTKSWTVSVFGGCMSYTAPESEIGKDE
jgi:hypothetical protein